MTGFVKLILEASVTAGLAALAVILIRLVMKKAPKRWAYALWAVVFFRCLCPFSAESAVSLFNVIPERAPEVLETTETSAIVSEINTRPPVMEQVEKDLQSYGYTPYPVPVSAEPVLVNEAPAPVKKPVNKNAVIFAVWAAGALAMALYGAISYILLMRKLRTAVKTEDGVYESDLISTAFSAGFFPPRIYVPCGLFDEERKLIIAHERVHIRRLDYIVKPVAFLALAVHWFNPIIWLAFALMTRDMELSCDEAVLKIFGAGEKKAYSEALLHVSMKRSGLVDNYKFMPLAFAETGIKGRVKNVLKYKKPTLIVTVLAAAVVIAACVVLGTNAKSKAWDFPEEIEYIEFGQSVAKHLVDVNGNDINFVVDRINEPKNSGIYYSRALVEGDIDFDSSTVTFGDSSLKRLIMAVDMTEFKINSLEVFSEWGKNFLRAQFEFTLAEDAELPTRDGLIRLGGDDEPRMLMVEGGGNDRVYTVSAEYELKSRDSGQFAFMLKEFGDVPVYVNADLVKPDDTEPLKSDDTQSLKFDETVYIPLSEGETVYTLNSGERVRIVNDPDREVKRDSSQGITFNTEPEEGSKVRFVNVGFLDNNDHINGMFGADFTGAEITALAIDDISVSQDKFNVKLKITYAEGGGGFFANENEPNFPLRLVRGENENEAYLYFNGDYDRENVNEYFIEFIGFDNITPQINIANAVIQPPESQVVYEQVFSETKNLSLNGYFPAYLVCGLNESGKKGVLFPVDIDGIRALSNYETGIYGFNFHNAYTNEMETVNIEDYGSADHIRILGMITKNGMDAFTTSVFDMDEYAVKSITLEDMYTQTNGSMLYLNIKLKFTSDADIGFIEKVSHSVSDTPGNYSSSIEKGDKDGEYTASLRIKYNDTNTIDSFAVVLCGFEDAEKYVNSKLVLDNFYELYDFGDTEAYENAKIQKVYKNGFADIRLYDGGLFYVTNSISSFMPVIGSKNAYRYEDDKLILEFNDGSELYFDVVYDTVVKDDKLVYNEKLSHITDARSRKVPHYDNGEVFLPDEERFLILKAEERKRNSYQYNTVIDYNDVKMEYSHDFKTIYLYNDGKFEVCDFSNEYAPVNDLRDGYSIDGETLVLKFTDGSRLCFDMVSSGMEITDPELVEEREMYKYKLVYNKELSNISDGQSGDIPDYYNGEVFAPDEGFIEVTKSVEESASKYAEEMEQQRQRIYEELAVLKREAEERKNLEEQEKNNASVTASYPYLQYPVDGVITSGYGDGRGHKGADFYAEKGTDIYAAAEGTVSETGSGWNGGYGTSVTIDHGSGIETLYAHLSDITVKEGDEVAKGDLIGHAGSTGDSTQNGTHFEIRVNGKHVDPVKYIALQERGTVSANYHGMYSTLILNKDGTFSVENYSSSHIPSERPEKEYKFENGILSLEFTNGSVICFEAVGNDLVYRKDLSNYIYSSDMPSFGSNDTFELMGGTSLNGGSIEMDTIKLKDKTYCLVSNETQLRAIGGTLYGLDLNYIQQCDIELSPDEWKAIGTRANPFTGSYNGNGFEIKGLTMTDPYATLIGMFGYAENANIYNITLRDYDIEKAGSKAKQKSVAPIIAINVGSRVYDNNVYPKGE